MVSDCAKHVAVDPTDPRVIGIAEAGRARYHRGKNAIQICRRGRNRPQNVRSSGLLLSRLLKLALGPGKFFRQLLVSAFRRGKIVAGQSCHDYTLPIQLARRGFGLPPWRRLASEAVGMLRDVTARWNVLHGLTQSPRQTTAIPSGAQFSKGPPQSV